MKLSVVLLLCSCCALFKQNCEAQATLPSVETSLAPSVSNCMCEVGHGKCAENSEFRCDPGWGGPRCDDCVRMPGCVHGTCHQPWQCTCIDGWTGRFCDKDIYVCSREEPCQNGATCDLNDSGEYQCFCPEGFHGRDCEFKTGPCQKTKSPCKNGGLCEDLGGYAPELSCRCLVGFTGPRCETNMDDCLMRPCANGATCLDGVNRFSCQCPSGFTGRFCTINRDDCASQPCHNGGRCIDRVSAFQCVCPPGYTGRTCEVPLWETKELPSFRGAQSWGEASSVTQSKSAPKNHSHMTTASGDVRRLFKISVKEVVTQHRPAGLPELQLIILLVLGGMTLAVVTLTAGLVLRGHCQDRSAHCQCRPPPAHNFPFHRCRTQRPRPVPILVQQECKISFLQSPAPPDLQKKRLNTNIF